MKVLRLIQYEGTPEQIADQLGRSLADGVRQGNTRVPTITICTLQSHVWEALITACATGLVTVVPQDESLKERV